MIILKFDQSDNDEAYHLFKDRHEIIDYLWENYDNVKYYDIDDVFTFSFDEISMNAKIIKPIIH